MKLFGTLLIIPSCVVYALPHITTELVKRQSAPTVTQVQGIQNEVDRSTAAFDALPDGVPFSVASLGSVLTPLVDATLDMSSTVFAFLTNPPSSGTFSNDDSIALAESFINLGGSVTDLLSAINTTKATIQLSGTDSTTNSPSQIISALFETWSSWARNMQHLLQPVIAPNQASLVQGELQQIATNIDIVGRGL